ncbi:chemotaxis protein CheD [Bryocella elongata]|uniref:Probable chemoreceptor glutamine deamidase CheD n=1 Tax=Bryocella elongata TaxID=863522 RepID=A0A1H5TIZ8_9BACT|nr:chemotaxis protein CheD [Bryocella elongata]SEF61987.1 chemotaxis protein CheD [Bryocella elongata]
MSQLVVGIGDCQVSADPQCTLITYALGSCIAVAVYDPVTKVGGLLHYLLPDSNIDLEKAQKNPFMFGDTGIPELFHRAYRMGAQKQRLIVSVAGGAQVMSSEYFNIGKRNQLVAKKVLWRAGVLVRHEETGGESSRTLRMELATGQIMLRTAGRFEVVLGSTPNPVSKKGAQCA